MALVKNRVEVLNEKLAALEQQRISLEAKLAGTHFTPLLPLLPLHIPPLYPSIPAP